MDFDVFGSFTNFSFQHFQKYQTNQAKQLQLQWNFNSPESVKCHLFFLNFVNFCQGKIVFLIKNKLNGITAFWNLVIEFLYIAFSSPQTRDWFSFTLIQHIIYSKNVSWNTKLRNNKLTEDLKLGVVHQGVVGENVLIGRGAAQAVAVVTRLGVVHHHRLSVVVVSTLINNLQQ